MVDQSAIGKSARANPVTYVGAWDTIRKRFAAEALSRERGYTADTFGFNAGTGRCPTCQGAGFEHVEMQFLSDVYLRCPDCDGKRFRPEVLEVEWLGADGQTRNVWQFLEMTVQEAVVAFGAHRDVVRALEPLTSVGLGYLRLGQPLTPCPAARRSVSSWPETWSGPRPERPDAPSTCSTNRPRACISRTSPSCSRPSGGSSPRGTRSSSSSTIWT